MSRFVFVVFLALVSAASAQIIPGRFIVELNDEAGAGKGRRWAAAERLTAVRVFQAQVRSALADRGFASEPVAEVLLNALAVDAAPGDDSKLAATPGVAAVYPVHLYRRLLDRAVALQRVQDAWNLAGGVENAGRGVKIGIIDTGIDSAHEAFQDPDLAMPEGYPRTTPADDTSNVNSKVIVSRRYPKGTSRDTEGHGTGVAMIAAGRTIGTERGTISGIAPKAWLGAYKVFADGADGASSDAILRAIDDAVADGMDIINLSLGSFPVSDPSRDVLVRAIDRANEAGVIAVVASGNSGPDAGTVGSPGTAVSAITVGNAWSDRIFASSVRIGEATLFARPGDRSEKQPSISGRLRNVEEFDPTGLLCAPAPSGSLTGRVAFILRGECYFEEKLRNAQAGGALAALIYTHSSEPSVFLWSQGEADLPGIMIGYQDGSAVRSVLRAGRTLEATLNFAPAPVSVVASRLNTSSSRGPSTGGAVKPELLAVGTSVHTASTVEEGRSTYQVSSGTSFSAPMVAGALAVLKQLRPGLRPDQYRSLLVGSAATFTYVQEETPAPVQHTGAGLLDLGAAARSTVATFPHTLNFGVGSGDADRTVRLRVDNLGSADDTFAVEVRARGEGPTPLLSHTVLMGAAGSSSQLTVRFQAGGLTPREYQGFVVVRSTATDSQAIIPYWYGVPSGEVERITVGEYNDTGRRGALRTFEVRPSDAAGLAVDVEPEVVVMEGSGSVAEIRKSEFHPDFWTVEVRLGPGAGANVFEVRAGGRAAAVRITGE